MEDLMKINVTDTKNDTNTNTNNDSNLPEEINDSPVNDDTKKDGDL
jgi:hypothetical protein